MYPDSNSIGLFVVCLIAFIFGMPPAYKSRLTRYLPILIILLFGSLSRASIITFFAILLFQFSKRFQAKTVIRTFFLVGGSVLTYSLIIFDESFQSKLWLIDLVQDHVLYADAATLFIGVGPGNGSAQIGVGTHILPFTLLVEVGICGFALIATLWYKIWRLAPEACTPIFLALLLNGLSFSSFAIPWFYAMVFVLVSLSREASGARFNTYSRL